MAMLHIKIHSNNYQCIKPHVEKLELLFCIEFISEFIIYKTVISDQ